MVRPRGDVRLTNGREPKQAIAPGTQVVAGVSASGLISQVPSLPARLPLLTGAYPKVYFLFISWWRSP